MRQAVGGKERASPTRLSSQDAAVPIAPAGVSPNHNGGVLCVVEKLPAASFASCLPQDKICCGLTMSAGLGEQEQCPLRC